MRTWPHKSFIEEEFESLRKFVGAHKKMLAKNLRSASRTLSTADKTFLTDDGCFAKFTRRNNWSTEFISQLQKLSTHESSRVHILSLAEVFCRRSFLFDARRKFCQTCKFHSTGPRQNEKSNVVTWTISINFL